MSNLLITLVVMAGVAVIVIFYFKKLQVDRTQSESIRDLERRLTDLMTDHFKDIKDSQLDDSKERQKQISSFTKETTQIRDELRQVQEIVKDVSSFQEIFKTPKLKGQWGEASLEHILSQHFPGELYTIQYPFSSGEQVDAILKLPNGRILPIDAKFPSENFGKMIEAMEEKKEYFKKKFIEDVKLRINEVASRYILPSEGTLKYALMYIPAETIYYEIVNQIGKEIDLVSYAWSRKIILASPNTIYLTLNTIEHWFRDTQVSRQTQEILKRLNRVQQDAEKLADDFRKLGGHLRSAVSAYDYSEKRLGLFSDKVERLLESKETKKLKEK